MGLPYWDWLIYGIRIRIRVKVEVVPQGYTLEGIYNYLHVNFGIGNPKAFIESKGFKDNNMLDHVTVYLEGWKSLIPGFNISDKEVVVLHDRDHFRITTSLGYLYRAFLKEHVDLILNSCLVEPSEYHEKRTTLRVIAEGRVLEDLGLPYYILRGEENFKEVLISGFNSNLSVLPLWGMAGYPLT